MKVLIPLCPLFLLIACSAPVGVIATEYGEMRFRFYEETPTHQAIFTRLAGEQYWDTLTINRVIDRFVIQGGCPDTPAGFADSPYLLEGEFSEQVRHRYGSVGMGRDDNPEKRSAGCQFYIVDHPEGLPRLDGDYTIFGELISGFEVLETISALPTDSLDAPLRPVTMRVWVE